MVLTHREILPAVVAASMSLPENVACNITEVGSDSTSDLLRATISKEFLFYYFLCSYIELKQ